MRLIALLTLALCLSAADGTVSKSPVEVLDLSLDFTARAANGITLVSVTAINVATGVDDTASLIVTPPATPVPAVVPATQKVTFRIFGGTDKQSDNLLVRVTKNDTGETLEGNILLHILNKR
jgi:hypothetical protein